MVLVDCIETWCNKNNIDKSALTKWEWKVDNRKVDEKIKILPNNLSVKYHKNVSQQKKPSETLISIQNEFVVTPIDKTNGNFYTLLLIKELGSDQNTTSINKTYIRMNKN